MLTPRPRIPSDDPSVSLQSKAPRAKSAPSKPAEPAPFLRRQLLSQRALGWFATILLLVLTLAAGLMLLGFSGWFITASAAAGFMAAGFSSFNYLQPGAFIRFCAIVRTGGRYAERIVAHYVLLQLLADLRQQVLQRYLQSAHKHTPDVEALQRMISDIDVLDQFPLRFVNPWLAACAVSLLWLGLVAWWLPQHIAAACLFVLFNLLILPVGAILCASRYAAAEVWLRAERREQWQQFLQLLIPAVMFDNAKTLAHQFQLLEQRLLLQQQRMLQQQHWLAVLQQLSSALLIAWVLWQGNAWVENTLPPTEAPIHMINTEQKSLTPHLNTTSSAIIPTPSGIAPNQQQVALWVALLLSIFALQELWSPLQWLPQAHGQTKSAKQRLNALLATPDQAFDMDRINMVSPASPDHKGDAPQRQSSSIHHAATTDHAFMPLLHLDALTVGYQQPLAAPIQQQFSAGDVVLLQGASGVGKTTLLHTLAGQQAALSGAVHVFSSIMLVPQQPYIFSMSIAANLRLAKPKASDQELMAILDALGLGEWLAQQQLGLQSLLTAGAAMLSGGEARRFALARSLLQPPAILLLDEPLAGLDAHTANRVLAYITNVMQHGVLIMSSHQWQDHAIFNRRWAPQWQAS